MQNKRGKKVNALPPTLVLENYFFLPFFYLSFFISAFFSFFLANFCASLLSFFLVLNVLYLNLSFISDFFFHSFITVIFKSWKVISHFPLNLIVFLTSFSFVFEFNDMYCAFWPASGYFAHHSLVEIIFIGVETSYPEKVKNKYIKGGPSAFRCYSEMLFDTQMLVDSWGKC